jgi:tetratricopeptide (TPR) repeat protein
MAIDVSALWDFGNPALSEQRFQAALADASGEDRLILYTQIARTHGLRCDFEGARQVLGEMEPQLQQAGPEVRARHALELGRTFASATHPLDSQTLETREFARDHYMRALRIAEEAGLDGLAIDAIHMLAFVDTAPPDQLKWGRKALAVSLASTQPAATRWEASIRNNVGYALHELGRFDEALDEFERALALREAGTNQEATHVAHWMVAWTLRSMGRTTEALEIQLRLEQQYERDGKPSRYVLEELEHIYQALGDEEKATAYAKRREALPK